MTPIIQIIQNHLNNQGIPTTTYPNDLSISYNTYLRITKHHITCITEDNHIQVLNLSDPQLLHKITNWAHHQYNQINHHIKRLHQHLQKHQLLTGYHEYRHNSIFISPQNLQLTIDDTTIHISTHWTHNQNKIILQLDTNDPNYLKTITKLLQ